MMASRWLRAALVLCAAAVLGAGRSVDGDGAACSGLEARRPDHDTQTGPANAAVGVFIDYQVTLSWTGGALTGPTTPYTLTDALPAEVGYVTWGAVPQGTCPTTPPQLQAARSPAPSSSRPASRRSRSRSGSTPNKKGRPRHGHAPGGGNSTVTTAIAPGTGGRRRRAGRRGDGDRELRGPDTITLKQCCAPERYGYRISLTYTGPTPSPSVHTRWTVKIPDQTAHPAVPEGGVLAGAIDNCTMPQTGLGVEASCDAFFTAAQRTVTLNFTVRPQGRTGIGTAALQTSTGATASVTTNFRQSRRRRSRPRRSPARRPRRRRPSRRP